MIDWKKPEYEAALKKWRVIDQACDEVDLGDFIIELNPTDISAENAARNKGYKARAVWFGASSMTLAGLIGAAFDDAPTLELGPLDYLKENADGQGVDLQSQMQAATAQVLRKARAGLFVSYPQTGPVSKADQGRYQATIHLIDAGRIINWWTVTEGSQIKLGGVVFTDTQEAVEDYEVKVTPVIRELALVEGLFVDRVWIERDKEWIIRSEVYPKDGAGKPWTEIPFSFIGALDNTASIDKPPPMMALVRLNIAHYRNSADFEESTHFAGQAQPYIDPGDNPEGLAAVLETAKEDGFYIGARQLIVGKFGFAQAAANPATLEAMNQKEAQMLKAGARFLEVGTVAKTATQASGEQKVQHSILSLVIANVEDAYQSAGRFAAKYMGADEPVITLSRTFMQPAVSIEIIDRLIALLDRGLIGSDDALPALKRANLIGEDKTPEDYSEDIDARGGNLGGNIGVDDAA